MNSILIWNLIFIFILMTLTFCHRLWSPLLGFCTVGFDNRLYFGIIHLFRNFYINYNFNMTFCHRLWSPWLGFCTVGFDNRLHFIYYLIWNSSFDFISASGPLHWVVLLALIIDSICFSSILLLGFGLFLQYVHLVL